MAKPSKRHERNASMHAPAPQIRLYNAWAGYDRKLPLATRFLRSPPDPSHKLLRPQRIVATYLLYQPPHSIQRLPEAKIDVQLEGTSSRYIENTKTR